MAKMDAGPKVERGAEAAQGASQEVIADRQEIQTLAAQRFGQMMNLGKSILKATVNATFVAAAYVERRFKGEGSIGDDLNAIKGKVVSTCTDLVAERQLKMQDSRAVALQSKIEAAGMSPEARRQVAGDISESLDGLNQLLKKEVEAFRAKPLAEQGAKESHEIISTFKACKDQVLAYGNQVTNALANIHASELTPVQKATLEKQVLELADVAAKSFADKQQDLLNGGEIKLSSVQEMLKQNANFSQTIRHMADHAVDMIMAGRETGSPEVVQHAVTVTSAAFSYFKERCAEGKLEGYSTPEYRQMLRGYAEMHTKTIETVGGTITKVDLSDLSPESKDLIKGQYFKMINAGEQGFAAEMNRQVAAGTWAGMESLKPLIARANQYAKLADATVAHSIAILATGEQSAEVAVKNRA